MARPLIFINIRQGHEANTIKFSIGRIREGKYEAGKS